jgi:hypothetical protein
MVPSKATTKRWLEGHPGPQPNFAAEVLFTPLAMTQEVERVELELPGQRRQTGGRSDGGTHAQKGLER